MNIKIAIIDNDINYLERLSGVLQQYNELSVAVFTRIESFQQTMEFEDFQIVVFNPDISAQQLIFSDKMMPVCLCTEESVNRNLYQNIPIIQKYQRISNIYKQIIKNYAEHVKDSEMDYFKAASTGVIAVHSPIGGSGKTTLSLAIAGKLHKMGKSVLFLSMEQCNSSSVCCDIKEEGITCLVEALNTNSSFELKLKGILKQSAGGFYYIECFSRLVDYDDVKDEEIEKIIKKIKMCDVCDYIVIDTGSTLDGVNKAVLYSADRIVVVQRSGELADAKLSLFDRQILVNELREKLCVVKNFVMQGTRGYELENVPVAGEVRGYGTLTHNDLLGCIEQENNMEMSYLLTLE